MKEKYNILRLVSGTETFIIPETDGGKNFSNSRDFFYLVDPEFKEFGTDKKVTKTRKTSVQFYEPVEDADFPGMFGSLGEDLDKFCFTEHQVRIFCEKYHHYLLEEKLKKRSKGRPNFFLCKGDKSYYVARVGKTAKKISVIYLDFNRPYIFKAKDFCRVFVKSKK